MIHPASDNKPTEPGFTEIGVQDALEHIRASAEIIDNLGKMGIAGVPEILGEISTETQKIADHAKTEREKQERAGDFQSGLYEMINGLPHAKNIKVAKRTNVDGNSPDAGSPETYDYSTYKFEAESLADIRRTEALVWWVMPASKYLILDGLRGRHYEKAGLHYDTETTPPYYVVGERLTQANEDETDAYLSLLMVRATEDAADHPLIKVRTSLRLRDLSNELALAGLHDEVTRQELSSKYLRDAGTTEGFKLTEPEGWQKYRLMSYPSGIGMKVKLTDEPDSDSRKEKYWDEKKLDISRDGVPVQVDDEDFNLTLENFEAYNVAFHAQKLAILLGNEDAFKKTLGARLAQPSDAQ